MVILENRNVKPAAAAKTKSVPKTSSSEHAAVAIRDMILSGGWRPGWRLPSQRELALRLGISRPTIREALIALEMRGEVETLPGKGVYVASPAPDGADGPDGWSGYPGRGNSGGQVGSGGVGGAAGLGVPDSLGRAGLRSEDAGAVPELTAGKAAQMYQFRLAIEPAVAGLVAENATMAQMEDLRQLSGRMRAALVSGDLTILAQLDFAFHRQLVEAANNPFFTQAIAPSLDMFFESQQLPFASGLSVGETVAEHEALVDALQRRSPAEAGEAMRRHILGAASRAGISLVSVRHDAPAV